MSSVPKIAMIFIIVSFLHVRAGVGEDGGLDEVAGLAPAAAAGDRALVRDRRTISR
jgi:hypothetical protein